MRIATLIAALALGAIGLAGCGGDDNAADANPGTHNALDASFDLVKLTEFGATGGVHGDHRSTVRNVVRLSGLVRELHRFSR